MNNRQIVNLFYFGQFIGKIIYFGGLVQGR